MKQDNLVVTPIPTLADLIKNRREEKNMTQSALASAANLQPAELSRLENGITKKPSKEVLKKLSPLLGISFSQLLIFAGYSCIIDDEQFFDKEGNLICSREILRNIYSADYQLLLALQNINMLSQEDVVLLTDQILLMKKLSSIQSHKTSNRYLSEIVKQFEITKDFLSKQLKQILHMISLF